ncbi:MAG: molybdenum cofactor guanylyltransferase [Thermovenabulum sp.]|uniref:molybdenum cofactor guanylyltransferase n=1 Tax=Thermovenabulum sp. TaxID=3100335 RepID=UPI003C7D0924
MNLSAVILNGGSSKRLGIKNKGLLKINDKTLLEIIYEVLKSIFEEIIIITNFPEDVKSLKLNVSLYTDEIPGLGPLGGIYTGLKKISCEKAFFVACDMPFIRRDLILRMSKEAFYHEAVCPCYEDYIEPLHAFYGKDCLSAIKEILTEKRNLKVREIFNYVDTCFFKVSEKDFNTFFNINSWEDYRKIRSFAE